MRALNIINEVKKKLKERRAQNRKVYTWINTGEKSYEDWCKENSVDDSKCVVVELDMTLLEREI